MYKTRLQGRKAADITSAADIKIGDGTSATVTGTTDIHTIYTLNWLSGALALLEFSGTLILKHQGTSAAGYARLKLAGKVDAAMYPGNSILFWFDGTDWVEVARYSNRLRLRKGNDIASANDLTLGGDGTTFGITGGTTINRIALWPSGSWIRLKLASAITIAHQGAANTATLGRINFQNAQNFSAQAGDTLDLWTDGVEWFCPYPKQMLPLRATATWDPGNMAADGDTVSTTITVTGAVTSDQAIATHDQIGANNVLISAHVQAADTVRVTLMNKTGGALDIASGTLAVKVWK
jgi:hypothetical protein